jgi:integrase
MSSERLVPGGRPKKHLLEPVKGPDGIWHLDRIRHRTLSGAYTRTSASGRTKKECLAQWEDRFEKNRHKGSVRTTRSDVARIRFTADDKMIDVFEHFIKMCKKKVEQGKIKAQTVDGYSRAIFPCHGKNSSGDAIKLEKELGHLTVGEVGDTAFLCDYLDDIYALKKGTASVHYQILTQVFRMLTRIGPFKYDPMAPVSNPYVSGGTQRALKPAERDALFDLFCTRAPHTKYRRILFLLLLGTGMRIGEVLGLRWTDVDLREGSECAVIHVCGTIVQAASGGKAHRQDKRKNNGQFYFLTLPLWLTVELREWRSQAGPVDDSDHVLVTMRKRFLSIAAAEGLLRRIVGGTSMDWVQLSNFRDTAATHVKGKTGDASRASAQLGHSEASTMAIVHYIDKDGYQHPAVDNSAAMESLKPSKLEQNWNFSAA